MGRGRNPSVSALTHDEPPGQPCVRHPRPRTGLVRPVAAGLGTDYGRGQPPPRCTYTQGMSGVLRLVATPIGNLEDITYRAVRVLREADLIACEDTRQTRKLLDHYGIQTPTISYHEHNEATRAAELAARLAGGASIALVSDAGMPLVSDPGYRVVRAAIDAGIRGGTRARRFGGADRAGGVGAAHRRFPFRRLPAAQSRPAAETAGIAGRTSRRP